MQVAQNRVEMEMQGQGGTESWKIAYLALLYSNKCLRVWPIRFETHPSKKDVEKGYVEPGLVS